MFVAHRIGDRMIHHGDRRHRSRDNATRLLLRTFASGLARNSSPYAKLRPLCTTQSNLGYVKVYPFSNADWGDRAALLNVTGRQID
jgi:hypothetical protein